MGILVESEAPVVESGLLVEDGIGILEGGRALVSEVKGGPEGLYQVLHVQGVPSEPRPGLG